ncbi:MAG: hypothetical protein ACK5JH_13850 [Anaerocolumna sp.]
MTNEQIAHDLAVARMAGKQLPADILVSEYQSSYNIILEHLNDVKPKKKASVSVLK